ncbi:MAG: PorT family protein [Reichenbachiella sp.]
MAKFLSLFFISFIYVLATPVANAQLQMDVHFGVITNQIDGDRSSEVFGIKYLPSTAFQAGVSLDFKVAEDVFISVQPGYKNIESLVLLENENYENEILDKATAKDALKWIPSRDLTIHNVVIPVFIKIISDNDRFQYHAGIEASIPFSAKEKDKTTGESSDVLSHINEINLYAILGIGYRFNLFSTKFTFDLFYSQSVNNISSETALDPNFPVRMKVSGVETRLSWRIPTKK